jgi:putative molybdopterin biosynthesis protein
VRRYTVRLKVVFEVEGKEAVDERLATLLAYIEKYGSILAASRAVGLPYSRAWESIVRSEALLGVKLVVSRRGGPGGGTALTDEGRKLLDDYIMIFKEVTGRDFISSLREGFRIPELTYMGSHDPGVEVIAGMLRKEGVEDIELSWVGSGLGIAAISLGEADLAGIHLYDEGTDKYNLPFLKKYWLEGKAVLVRGYDREIGVITRERMSLEEVMDGLFRGDLVLINRQPGSGSRVLLDAILKSEALKRGISPSQMQKVLKGYSHEVSTHIEVAKAIVSGEADVGVCIRWAAAQYGANFIPLRWERFDFITLKERLKKDSVKAFINALRSEGFKNAISALKGYRIGEDAGEIVNKAE